MPLHFSSFEPLRLSGDAGDVSEFLCEQSPPDIAFVQRVGNPGDAPCPPAVAVGALQQGDGVVDGAFVLLTPADARRMAAALLNAADECDGTTPLVFLPEAAR